MTGSHNLGFKASSDNDDNLMIIEGNAALAAAYAANIIAIYQTYRWNAYVEAHRQDPKVWHGLVDNDYMAERAISRRTTLPKSSSGLGRISRSRARPRRRSRQARCRHISRLANAAVPAQQAGPAQGRCGKEEVAGEKQSRQKQGSPRKKPRQKRKAAVKKKKAAKKKSAKKKIKGEEEALRSATVVLLCRARQQRRRIR